MVVDILIILVLLSALARGREIGFVRQLCSTVGFFGGLVLGVLAQPHFLRYMSTLESRAMMTLLLVLGLATILLALGEYIGVLLKARLQRRQAIDKADVVLGSVAGGLTFLITIWLIAPVLTSLPFPSLQRAVRNSAIVTELNTSLPTAPSFISDISRLINPNGFPEVFSGLEPKPPADAPLPDLGALNAAVQKDRASVVKIEGNGCGGIVQGSGFVAAKELVVTNAHVVAGIAQPYVLDANGQHQVSVIWFDPDLDLAVLRVHNLAGKPLSLNTARIRSGTTTAVLGYPGGGGFTAGGASVLDEFIANGRNIYGQGTTARDVYELKANIIPGNSGGPLIDANGNVIGVIFAESTTYNQVGYALTMQKVVSDLNQAATQNTPVSTGTCAE